MFRQGIHPTPAKALAFLLAAGALLFPGTAAQAAKAAVPFNQATITKLENVVNYGDSKAGAASRRRAAVSDVVRANNYLLTETESRAELEYPDGSVVRIGQNTVFSFDANTRTLALEKGSLIFFIPKGSGGGTVKTPSLTAAITGTVGKVSENMITILEGEVTLVPSGRQVSAGHFARMNVDRTITIAPFDLSTAMDGKLMNFRGPMPHATDFAGRTQRPIATPRLLSDTLERTQNLPGSIKLLPLSPVIIPDRTPRAPRPINNPPRRSPGSLPIY